MRFLVLIVLAAIISAGENPDPLAQRIKDGFAAWTAVDGNGTAACALWTAGSLPAASAQTDVVARHLDTIPAKIRKQPKLDGPIHRNMLVNGTTSTSTIYMATVDAGEQSVILGFGYAGNPLRLAALASGTGRPLPLLQADVRQDVLMGMGGGKLFNPGHRSGMLQQPNLPDDVLGPYVVTAPAAVKIGKLVIWGPAVGKPVEIAIDRELSLVSLTITAGAKPTVTCRWTPADGAEGSRELPLLGSVPDNKTRGFSATGAATLESLRANPPIGRTFEQTVRGRDPLPKAWSAWIELSWGKLPGELSNEQAMFAQLPEAVLVTME